MSPSENTAMIDHSRRLKFVIDKVKYSKDDNEKIGSLFFIFQLKPDLLINEPNFIDLYNAISPTFIYRLLKSSQSEEPQTAEIILGLEILSLFVRNEQIALRKEITPMIDCMFSSIKCDGLLNDPHFRNSVSQILNCVLLYSKNCFPSIQKYIVQYLNFLKICNIDEVDIIVKNCIYCISKMTDSHLLIDFLLILCVSINSLDITFKFKCYDLVLKSMTQLKELGYTRFTDISATPIIDYILNFLTNSKPINHKATILLVCFLQISSMEIFYKSLKEKFHLDLAIRLSLIELELFINMICEKNTVILINKEIEACIFLIEAYVDWLSNDVSSDQIQQTILNFRTFLTDSILDMRNNQILINNYFTFIKLLCSLYSLCDETDIQNLTKFSQIICNLCRENSDITGDLIELAIPFINTFKCNHNKNLNLSNDLINIYIKVAEQEFQSFPTINDRLNSALIGFSILIEVDSFNIDNPKIHSFFKVMIEFVDLNFYQIIRQILSHLFHSMANYCNKFTNPNNFQELSKIIVKYKLKNILDKIECSDLFILTFLTILMDQKVSLKTYTGFENIESDILKSKTFAKTDEETRNKITDLLDKIRLF